MPDDALEQLQKDVQQLQQELQATQLRLQQVTQQLQQLQNGNAPAPAPNFLSLAAAQVKTPHPTFSIENFIGLRLIHLVGIVVLVIGLSIGVKYAIDQQLISEYMRIALAYGAGLLLYLLSWRLRKKYTAFSAILFSGAMASLYFTTYAAFVYYNFVPFALAFALMIVLTLFTVYQALAYNRQEIAVLGLVGAYAIPFLISSNSGRAEVLFMYVAIINTAVVFLAFKKAWNAVAWLAQGVTWLLLLGWALTRFTTAQMSTAFFFAPFFFLLFSTHALLNRIVRGQALQRWQVQQLFANNILLYVLIGIVYNASVIRPHFSTLNLGFALFTGLQAALCYFFLYKESHLKKGLVVFSLGLFLLFIANRWEGFTVTLLWLLLAVLLFGTGFGLKAMWLRLTGVVLMGITLAKLVFLDSLRFSTIQKIIAYLTLGMLLLAVGFFYQRFKEKLFDKEGEDRPEVKGDR